ncbi:MAG: molybdopterin molybdotransferase MoeA [Acidimicrobiia bacterium]|nr:molybdopterin molybdotransferase MoeA [Acidimicrobiia bacterium]
MKRLAAARREVIAAMPRIAQAEVPLALARGLVLAADVVAPHPVPPFTNSAVDGYAVRASDTASVPVELRVTGDLPAGVVSSAVITPGTAVRIMTGAALPGGADAMVMVEDTVVIGDRVRITRSAAPGDHVRTAGGDIAAGAVVLRRGDRLGPVHLGLLASIGVAVPVVSRRPVVAVLSTGDEIQPPDTATLRPGMIRDANRPMLVGLLGELGVEVRDLGIVPDDGRLLRSTLEEAAASCDAVVTSGGVSMGEHDLVKQVLAGLGRVEFWQVAMQPAKPFAFGFLGGTPLFGLPGNPVSSMVAFEQFVRPGLLAAMGATRLFRPRIEAALAEPVSTTPEKVVFLRVAFAGPNVVRSAGGQASNVLSALAAADGLAVIPVGVGAVAAGDRVAVELFRADESRTLAEATDD